MLLKKKKKKKKKLKCYSSPGWRRTATRSWIRIYCGRNTKSRLEESWWVWYWEGKDFSMMSELPILWALAMISQLPGTWKSVQSSCTQSNDTRSAQREPSAFLGRGRSETSQSRSSFADLTGTLQRLWFRRFLFFFFLLFKFFFNFSKTKNGEFFFWLEKAQFICIGKNKPPPPLTPFFYQIFSFFSKKTFMLENH